MRRDHQEFLDRGYAVVAIGHGTPQRAARYQQDLALPFPILADRHQQAYRAYGLGRAGYADFLDPKLYLGGVRAILAGSRMTKPSGDTRQLPGTFIIDPTGVVRLEKRAKIASDLASTKELIRWIDGESGL